MRIDDTFNLFKLTALQALQDDFRKKVKTFVQSLYIHTYIHTCIHIKT